MKTNILECKAEIEQWISEGQSKAFMARQLNCNPKTINPILEKLGLHYDGNQSKKGFSKPKDKWTLIEYLENSQDIKSTRIRESLLEENYKEYKCECCGQSRWLEKPIPLEMHHKDGNRYNNTLENFELLCPNCHAFTDSYRGKNCTKHRCRDHTPTT